MLIAIPFFSVFFNGTIDCRVLYIFMEFLGYGISITIEVVCVILLPLNVVFYISLWIFWVIVFPLSLTCWGNQVLPLIVAFFLCLYMNIMVYGLPITIDCGVLFIIIFMSITILDYVRSIYILIFIIFECLF